MSSTSQGPVGTACTFTRHLVHILSMHGHDFHGFRFAFLRKSLPESWVRFFETGNQERKTTTTVFDWLQHEVLLLIVIKPVPSVHRLGKNGRKSRTKNKKCTWLVAIWLVLLLLLLFCCCCFVLFCFVCFSTSSSLGRNSGRLVWVKLSSRKSSATHFYQCV